MADEEALRKIRSVEEQIDILNKKLSIAKQVREPLGWFSAAFRSLTLAPLRRRRTRCSARWT